MSDPMKRAWNDVADDFNRLGKVMKERYQGQADDDAAAAADRADADEGVRAAFERLLAAGRELGDRLADVVAGEEVRTQAKQTGQRLSDAMTTTADLLGEQVRGVFKGVTRRSDPVDTVADEAPAGSAPSATPPSNPSGPSSSGPAGQVAGAGEEKAGPADLADRPVVDPPG